MTIYAREKAPGEMPRDRRQRAWMDRMGERLDRGPRGRGACERKADVPLPASPEGGMDNSRGEEK
jgi:hypothetical protein